MDMIQFLRRMPSSTYYMRVLTNIGLLLLIAMALLACSRFSQAEGWSGGVIANDTLYIGTHEGTVRALHIGTLDSKGDMVPADNMDLGQLVWEFALRGDKEHRAIYGTPAVVDDVVYVGGYDGYLYVLTQKADGDSPREPELIWQERIGREPDKKASPIVASPVVAGGLVLVASSDGFLYAYDRVEQSEVWRFQTKDRIWSTPTVYQGVVYFGSLDKNLYAVSLEDGTELWRYSMKGAVASSPVVSEGRVFVGSFDAIFYALNANTGLLEWSFEGASNWFWGDPIVHQGIILSPSLDGNLYALDADTGTLKWTIETEEAVVGSPAVVSDMVVLQSEDGRVRVVRFRDGAELDFCNLEEGVWASSSLVAKDNHVYLTARDNSVRSLKIKPNGNPDEIWIHLTKEDDPLPRGRASSC